jgi:hypothetical protein
MCYEYNLYVIIVIYKLLKILLLQLKVPTIL